MSRLSLLCVRLGAFPDDRSGDCSCPCSALRSPCNRTLEAFRRALLGAAGEAVCRSESLHQRLLRASIIAFVANPVRLTVVPDEGEAEALCGLLRSEGIRCAHVTTNIAHAEALWTYGGWREVLVDEADLTRGRELLTAEGLDVSCAECGRPIGEDGRRYSDGVGELHPYCAACAEREFGP